MFIFRIIIWSEPVEISFEFFVNLNASIIIRLARVFHIFPQNAFFREKLKKTRNYFWLFLCKKLKFSHNMLTLNNSLLAFFPKWSIFQNSVVNSKRKTSQSITYLSAAVFKSSIAGKRKRAAYGRVDRFRFGLCGHARWQDLEQQEDWCVERDEIRQEWR